MGVLGAMVAFVAAGESELGDPWTLPQPRALAEHDISVGGWLSGGVYGNQYGAPDNGPIGLRDLGDSAAADQLWIFAERKTDAQRRDWDWGGRVDYLFGVDAPDTQCFGDRTWDYGWNSGRDYGSAIPQLYGEVAHGDFKVKLGHFYTLIGYEVVQATGNFFYSHSYCHTFGEPFTHTGAVAEYALNEKVSAYGGWVNGWDEGWATKNHGSMFLGGLSLKFSEQASLAWYCTAGTLGDGDAYAGAPTGDLYMNSLVLNLKLSERWTYVFEHDLGTNFNIDPRDGENNQWYGIVNYLTCKLTDRVSYGGRFEWFQDPQGARVVAGDRGSYCALTGGLNWKPRANFTLRPEIRYDWYNGSAGPDGLPFAGGNRSSQLSGGADCVFTY